MKITFFEKALEKHNNYYSYDKVDYINAKTNILITCPIHGDFSQLPCNHLQGKGCKKCGINSVKIALTKTNDNFIKQLNHIYGDIYDYSLVIYENDSKHVNILCHKHGIFSIRPSDLIYGRSCKLCNVVGKKISNYVDKTDEFIKKAYYKFGNKYDYSLVKYGVDNKDKVNIICKEHGIFSQSPNSHLRGFGCIYCNRITNVDFMKKLPNIFKLKYNYKNLEIKSTAQKIKLFCKKHGYFYIKVSSHLSGGDCQKCKSSKGENLIISFLDDNNIGYIYQHSFIDCFHIKALRFDFYIESLNLCIEYDGQQHFNPVSIFGGLESLNKQIDMDIIKNEYCLSKNIRLLRIPYYDFNKINDILKEWIN
jgi:hypothetical protein